MAEDLKGNYMELEQINKQVKEVREQLQKVEEQMREANYVLQTLDEYKKIEEGDELLVPVTNGIFMRARAEGPSQLVVNMGENCFVHRSIADTKKVVQAQAEEILRMQEQLSNTLEQLDEQMQFRERNAQEALRRYEDKEAQG